MTTTMQRVPKLRFPEFSGEWEEKKLGDVTQTISSGKTKVSDTGQYVVYGSTGAIGFTDINTYNGEILLVARVGANAGRMYRVDGVYGVTDNTLMVILNEDENIGYIQYYLTKFDLNRLIYGSGQPLVTGGILKKLKIPSPSLPEQQKIASFLSAVDSKIEALTKKKALLEQYKKGMMQKLFSQEIRFKDDQGNDFPEWEEKRLGDVLEMELRKRPKPQTNYLAIGVRSHMRGTFQKPDSDPQKISMSELFVVREDDLIVNITFAWEGAIALAKSVDDGGFVSHRFPTYRCKKSELISGYIKQVILNKRFKYLLDLISPGGAGRNRVLSKKDFLKIIWNIPSLPEQQKIADFLSSLDLKIELVGNELEKAQSFKKGLLQQMFV